MGETITQFLMYAFVIAIAFHGIITARNTIVYSNEHAFYKKSDGLILILIVYLLVFFMGINISSLNIDLYYMLPDHDPLRQFNFIPFTWIVDQVKMIEFYEHIGRDWQLDFLTKGIYIHYLRFTIQILPLVIIVYVINSKKWIGFIVAEVVGVLAMIFRMKYFIGDGMVFIAVLYIIIALFGIVIERVLSNEKYINLRVKIKLILSYGAATLCILIGIIFVYEIDFYPNRNEKLIGTIEVDENYGFYDDLLKLNITHVHLYEDSRNETIKLNGKLSVDESLSSYFGEGITSDVQVSYNYKFYGNNMTSGRDSDDFEYLNEETYVEAGYRWQDYVELSNYGSYKEVKGKWIPKKDDESQKFFQFNGISEFTIQVSKNSVDEICEIIETELGKDEYYYYEYTYKVKKINGKNINAYVYPKGINHDGSSIDLNKVDEKIIEETENYTIFKDKYYIYTRDGSVAYFDTLEAIPYGVNISFEVESTDILFSYDKEDFE